MSEERGPHIERTEEEKAANAAKLQAEAAKAEAERIKVELETEGVRVRNAIDDMLLEQKLIDHERKLRKELMRENSDDEKRVYRFLEKVTASSARSAIETLIMWHRIDPGCHITIVFDSPGGSIIDGFALFDTILHLRANGHHVTTVSRGMAASMAGILLQAGDERVMSPQAALLIHEASFGAMGSYGKVEDQVEFVKKLQDRILDIFAARSNLTKEEIENRWHRKDWWMLAEEALELGFVDSIE